jgi:hypothetical protein
MRNGVPDGAANAVLFCPLVVSLRIASEYVLTSLVLCTKWLPEEEFSTFLHPIHSPIQSQLFEN